MSTLQEKREIYSTVKWHRLRNLKLNKNPLCERCEAQGLTEGAVIVHHIVPVRDGGPKFPKLEGLEALCISCHSLHHNTQEYSKEQRKFLYLLESL